MKNFILRRFIPAFLCVVLVLTMTACGRQNGKPAAGENGGTTGTLSGSKEAKASADEGAAGTAEAPSPSMGEGAPEGDGAEDTAEGQSIGGRKPGRDGADDAAEIPSDSNAEMEEQAEPAVDSEQAEASLALLRDSMAFGDRLAGAVAYLGYREQGDSTPLSDWMWENCCWMAAEMQFLMEIPPERILGAGYGDLYCIVPRDEDTSLSVNHVRWESLDYDSWPMVDEILYRAEYADPVLVFVNVEEWPEEPDKEIILVTNDGVEALWYPMTDADGFPIVPADVDGFPVLLDFTIYDAGSAIGDPGGEDPVGGEWWVPPTDWGLAYTSWTCEHWFIDISWGDSDPEYSGIINLYYQAEAGLEYDLAYSGVWRMEDDCLRLELSDGTGASVSGSFPVLIAPSGETLHIQQERGTYYCPPFFAEGMAAMELTLSYD